MTSSSEARGGGVYLAVVCIALVAVVYLAFQLIGFLFKLAFLVLAALIGMAAWRAWKGDER
jgi:uncharacterized Tic20 family protein